MYAVVQTGGKQYRVSPGDVIVVNRLPGQDGELISLSEVLMVGDGVKSQVGLPLVKDAQVRATIVEQARGEKIIVFKKKRRQGYRRKHGHLQEITVLRVMEIEAGALKAKAEPKAIVKKSEKIRAAHLKRNGGSIEALPSPEAPPEKKAAAPAKKDLKTQPESKRVVAPKTTAKSKAETKSEAKPKVKAAPKAKTEKAKEN